MKTEENYVESLRLGILNYVMKLDNIPVPNTLYYQRFNLFCNIEKIHEYHENKFLPSLRACDFDVEEIIWLFDELLKTSEFDVYVTYAMNQRVSQKLVAEHKYYFASLSQASEDKLGIVSFLLQPVQRLPRYQMLLSKILKELFKNADKNRKVITKLCAVERNLNRLLDTVNNAVTVSDIIKCDKIDPLSHGKFKMKETFILSDTKSLRRSFTGIVFLFERALIFTEKSSDGTLKYRNHFDTEKMRVKREGAKEILIVEGNDNFRTIKLRSDDTKIDRLMEMITEMIIKAATNSENVEIFNRVAPLIRQCSLNRN